MQLMSRRHLFACVSTVAISSGLLAFSRAVSHGAAIASYPIEPGIPSEIPEDWHIDDVALISGQATGSKSADLFSGFASPASTIVLRSGTKFLVRSDRLDKLLLTSTHNCLDSELSTWMQKGIVF